MERWLPFPDFEGRYEISSHGRVRSLLSDRILRPGVGYYLHVSIAKTQGGKKHSVKIHTAVLTAFKGPKPFAKAHGRHINGVNTDNSEDNLEWGSCKDNAEDKEKHGTLKKGEQCANAKLTAADALAIRNDTVSSYKSLAAQFGCSVSSVYFIKKRVNWKHL